MSPQLEQFSNNYIPIINQQMLNEIKKLQAPSQLIESMNYSLAAGGKRIRPLLLLATLETFGKDVNKGLDIACALEMVHTYSLIHDDLPSMDDDDFRRGKPTNHKKFGEALAILAGDGLLTYSFQLIAEAEGLTDEQKVKLITLFSKCAGPEGMVGGQVADIEAENRQLNVDELQYIHENKTGRLLSFAAVAGAIIADANEKQINLVKEYAYHIGIAFQIRDDILDVIGKEEDLGKPVGSDFGNEKSTYPALLTLDGAKKALNDHIQMAKQKINKLQMNIDLLEQLATKIEERNH